MSEGTAFSPFSRLCPRLLRKHAAWLIWHIPLTQKLHLQPLAPAKNADWMNAHYARLRSSYDIPDKPFALGFTNPDWKGAWYHDQDQLYVHFVRWYRCKLKIQCGLCHGFWWKQIYWCFFRQQLAGKISACIQKHLHLNTIIVALESTSVYSIHIANILSSCELLMPYKPYVYYWIQRWLQITVNPILAWIRQIAWMPSLFQLLQESAAQKNVNPGEAASTLP